MSSERAVRPLVAGLVSVCFHIFMIAVFVRPGDSIPRQPQGATSTPVPVFLVESPGAAPGLKPFLAGHELFEFEGVQRETTLPLPGFTLDVSKISSRASLLFPFLVPGLALDAFGRMSDRSSSHRLLNPLTTSPGSDTEPLTALSL